MTIAFILFFGGLWVDNLANFLGRGKRDRWKEWLGNEKLWQATINEIDRRNGRPESWKPNWFQRVRRACWIWIIV